MSEGGDSFNWGVSLGNVLAIIVSISAIAAALWKILGYIKSKVGNEAVLTRKELSEQISAIEERLRTSDEQARRFVPGDVMRRWMDDKDKEMEEFKSETKVVSAKFSDVVEDKVRIGERRIDEIKWMFERIQEQSDRRDKDIEKKMDEHKAERVEMIKKIESDYSKIVDQFADLKDQFYKVSVNIASIDRKVNGQQKEEESK